MTEKKQSTTAQSIPLIREFLQVDKEQVQTGVVRIKKIVHEREQPVSVSLQSQSVSVERVPVNQVVAQTFEARQEGSTLVVPIFEEVVVKQIVLKEEIRITVQDEMHALQQSVVLRSEEAVIETHGGADGEAPRQAS